MTWSASPAPDPARCFAPLIFAAEHLLPGPSRTIFSMFEKKAPVSFLDITEQGRQAPECFQLEIHKEDAIPPISNGAFGTSVSQKPGNRSGFWSDLYRGFPRCKTQSPQSLHTWEASLKSGVKPGADSLPRNTGVLGFFGSVAA